jgi:hypothetical protein
MLICRIANLSNDLLINLPDFQAIRLAVPSDGTIQYQFYRFKVQIVIHA